LYSFIIHSVADLVLPSVSQNKTEITFFFLDIYNFMLEILHFCVIFYFFIF